MLGFNNMPEIMFSLICLYYILRDKFRKRPAKVFKLTLQIWGESVLFSHGAVFFFMFSCEKVTK